PSYVGRTSSRCDCKARLPRDVSIFIMACAFFNGRATRARASNFRTVWLGSVGVALTVACDPAFTMTGSVTTVDGKPVAGATVSLRCDGVDQGGAAPTRADGSFVDDRIGWYPDTCVAAIRAPGFRARDVAIGAYCRARPSHLKDACLTVQLAAVLVPSAQLDSNPPQPE